MCTPVELQKIKCPRAEADLAVVDLSLSGLSFTIIQKSGCIKYFHFHQRRCEIHSFSLKRHFLKTCSVPALVKFLLQ